MTPCLFSVSYAGSWGQASLPLPEFIARAGRLGARPGDRAVRAAAQVLPQGEFAIENLAF